MLQINVELVDGQLKYNFKFLKSKESSKNLAAMIYLLSKENMGELFAQHLDNLNVDSGKILSILTELYNKDTELIHQQRYEMAQIPAIPALITRKPKK